MGLLQAAVSPIIRIKKNLFPEQRSLKNVRLRRLRFTGLHTFWELLCNHPPNLSVHIEISDFNSVCFSFVSCTCRLPRPFVLLRLIDLANSTQYTDHEVRHYAMFSGFLSHLRTQLRIFSAPCLHTSLVYVPSLWRQTDINTYAKQGKCALYRRLGVYSYTADFSRLWIIFSLDKYFTVCKFSLKIKRKIRAGRRYMRGHGTATTHARHSH